jgi:hypothetical protein
MIAKSLTEAVVFNKSFLLKAAALDRDAVAP